MIDTTGAGKTEQDVRIKLALLQARYGSGAIPLAVYPRRPYLANSIRSMLGKR